MALTREQKEAILKQYVEQAGTGSGGDLGQLSRHDGAAGCGFSGSSFVRAGAEVVVVKNTLMRLALEQLERPTSAR